jgi:hypothetical protein
MTRTVDKCLGTQALSNLLLVPALVTVMLTAKLAWCNSDADAPVVDDVLIVGLKSYPPQTIQAKLCTGPGHPYSAIVVAEDACKLEEYYKANGYLSARVKRDVGFSQSRPFVSVTFQITEGPRYSIKDVAVEGATIIPTEYLLSIMKARKGEVYDEHVVEGDVENIKDVYGYRGYSIDIRKVLEIDPKNDPGQVRVVYQLKEDLKPCRGLGPIEVKPSRPHSWWQGLFQ